MRIVCDEPLSVGYVVGQVRPPKWSVTIVVKGTFQLAPGAVATWADEPEPLTGDVRVDDEDPRSGLRYASDFAVYKPRADVLLLGTAHAPDDLAVPVIDVAFRVESFVKALRIVGERTWHQTNDGTVVSSPKAVTKMPVTYDHAFGGPDYPRNPVGRGHRAANAPNVENPQRPSRGPDDSAEPSGFAPLSSVWEPRSAPAGTYDETWRKDRWPWFPMDFDWGYFNAAPPDQQLNGYLRGDEELEFTNLHAAHSEYRSYLPGLRLRCFVEERSEEGLRLREIVPRLDTLWVDLDAEKLVLVWRGVAEVRSPKLAEIEHLFVFTEPLSEEPRSASDSYLLLTTRLAADDAEEPEESDAEIAADDAFEKVFADMDVEIAAADEEFVRLEQDAMDMLKKQQAQLIEAGVNPQLFDEPVVPQTLAQVRVALAAEAAKLRRTETELAAHLGDIDFGELEDFVTEMEQLERELDADEEPAPPTRATVEAAARPGAVFDDQDFSNLDLSGLSFSGVSFVGAILAGTNLREANLSGALLRDADLSAANLQRADLAGADLSGADLSRADLAGARLVDVKLHDTTLAELNLAGADFSRCEGAGVDFSSCNLRQAQFSDARLPQADFSESDLHHATFERATLTAARFEGVRAEGIRMAGADLTGVHASERSDFRGGDFRHLRAPNSTWEEAILDGADFTRAILTNAQLSGASLRNAVFDRADLRGAFLDDACLQKAILSNANLLRALFERADLRECSFRGANLYEASFWEAIVADADFRGANLKGTTLVKPV